MILESKAETVSCFSRILANEEVREEAGAQSEARRLQEESPSRERAEKVLEEGLKAL